MGGSQGLLSDTDIESEIIRWAGDIWYIIFGIIRWLFMRVYELKIRIRRDIDSEFETLEFDNYICFVF